MEIIDEERVYTCPLCMDKIQHLEFYDNKEEADANRGNLWDVQIDDAGEKLSLSWRDRYILDRPKNNYEYNCPKCHETITTLESEALAFLKGESTPVRSEVTQ